MAPELNLYPRSKSQEGIIYFDGEPHLMERDIAEIFIREYLYNYPTATLEGIEPSVGSISEFLSTIDDTKQVSSGQLQSVEKSSMNREGDIHISRPDIDLYVEVKGHPSKELDISGVARKITNAFATIEQAAYNPSPTEIYGLVFPRGVVPHIKNRLFVNGQLPIPKQAAIQSIYDAGSEVNLYLVDQTGYNKRSLKSVLEI